MLCYHAISEEWPAALAVTPAQLRRQLEWLLERGYRGATFHDALTEESPNPTLVVTFDDAFLSVLELGQPILASLGLPATVFVVTDFAGDGRPVSWPGLDYPQGEGNDAELRSLTWSQLEQLADSGWEIGSHTQSHPRLTGLPDEALARELRESREACERALRRPCRSLAYPFGDFDARICAAAREAGYTAAAIEDVRAPTLLAWPRVGIYRTNSMRRFRLKVLPAVRGVRAALGTRGARHTGPAPQAVQGH